MPYFSKPKYPSKYKKYVKAKNVVRDNRDKALQRVWTAIKKVNKKAIGEYKTADTDVSLNNMTGGTGTFVNITQISGGTTENQRVGRECSLRSVNLKMKFLNNLGALPTNDDINVYVVLDKRNHNPAPPVFTDIFNITANGFVFRNRDFMDFFNIWPVKMLAKDMLITEGINRDTSVRFNWFKKFKYPIKLTYEDANSNTGIGGQLYVLVYPNTTDSTLDMQGVARITFTED